MHWLTNVDTEKEKTVPVNPENFWHLSIPYRNHSTLSLKFKGFFEFRLGQNVGSGVTQLIYVSAVVHNLLPSFL